MTKLLLILTLPAFLIFTSHDSPGQDPPNIILLYADDLGYTDLSCQGSDYYRTPNIDRLASEGVTFTNAYAAAANCAPSRASLMTGLYTPRHGVFTVGNSDRGKGAHRRIVPVANKTVLERTFPTMAQVLKKAGYQTAVAGKWHLSKDPIPYGFDVNFGGLQWGAPRSYFSPYRNPNLKDGPAGEHLPDRLARDICEWITTAHKKDDPFFVYFPFYSVHTPIQARPDLIANYTGRSGSNHHHAKYAAMIEAMDLGVGKILDLLDELELAGDTVVVFTSDNGPHGAFSNAKPLRGSKGMFYEGGIREPFLVRWPGKIEPSSRLETPVHQIDLLPTFASLSGADPPERLDGVDLSPLFQGKPIPDRSLFWHFPAYLQGYGKDLGSPFQHFRTTPCGVIRQGDWKLIEYFEDGALELYHLRDDPSETKNRAAEQTKVRDQLHRAMESWRRDTKAVVPREKNPKFGGTEPSG